MPLQICKSHWQQLKVKVNEAGLSHFCSPNGQEALRRFSTAIESPNQDITLDTYDPLLFAHNAIFMNALQVGGIQLASTDQMLCPICALGADAWIPLAVADAKDVLVRISKGMAAA